MEQEEKSCILNDSLAGEPTLTATDTLVALKPLFGFLAGF